MGYDPEGTFLLGLLVGILVGVGLSAVSTATAVAPIVSTLNFGANIYMLFAAFGADMPEEDILSSDSYSQGGGFTFIPTYMRIAYAVQQAGKNGGNIFDAWLYYAEYSAHMYGWMILQFFDGQKIFLVI